MNRAELARALKAEGYTGPLEADAISKFLAEYGIELQYRGKTLAAEDITKALAGKKSVVIGYADDGKDSVSALKMEPMDDSDDSEEEEPAKSISPKTKRAEVEFNTYSPSATTRRAETKRYLQRLDLPRGHRRRAKSEDADQVRAFGAWAKGALLGRDRLNSDDRELIAAYGAKDQVTYDNALGGATVPESFEAMLIDNKEQYGVVRSVVGVLPMRGEPIVLPRRTSSVTVYSPSEAASITESQMGFDNVTLVPVKMAAYSEVSSELLNDSALNFGDVLAGEMAWALAEKEDDCAINGDGTSTYFGWQGFRDKLKGLSGTYTNIAGLTTATGNAYSEITLADLLGVHGNLPDYAASSAQWLCSRIFKSTVLDKLGLVPLSTGGGTTKGDVAGAVLQSFLGYPVAISQKMPRTEANDQVCALFGDFSRAAYFGEVRGGMQIAVSDQFKFQNDVLAFRATQRVAFNFHSPGNASATAADRVPGPVVGLITLGS